MVVNYSVINAFTECEGGGNPAGLVICDNQEFVLSEEDMQFIAKRLGFSETAFVMKSDICDFKIRFFTPNAEVDLCGHATIASFAYMFKQGLIKEGLYKQETKAGILEVKVDEKGFAFMEQNLPIFFEALEKEEIAKSLGIEVSHITDNLPVQVVSTGIKDILVPVKSQEIMKNLAADMKLISDISKKYDVTGYHVFTLDTIGKATAHCRNFAPLYDIPEESATGTSNGALSCYLFKYNLINEKNADKLVFEQGYEMGRPSTILGRLEVIEGKVKQVIIGGTGIIEKEEKIVVR